MSIRLTIYHKESAKPIVLTDVNATNFQDCKEKVKKVFESKNVYQIETNKDCLFGRPSELQAILISGENDVQAEPPKKKVVPAEPKVEKPEVSIETPVEPPVPVEQKPVTVPTPIVKTDDLDQAVREAEEFNKELDQS